MLRRRGLAGGGRHEEAGPCHWAAQAVREAGWLGAWAGGAPDSWVTNDTSVLFRCFPVSHMRCTVSTGTLGGCGAYRGADTAGRRVGHGALGTPPQAQLSHLCSRGAREYPLQLETNWEVVCIQPHLLGRQASGKKHDTVSQTRSLTMLLTLSPRAALPASCGRSPGTWRGRKAHAPSCPASAAG